MLNLKFGNKELNVAFAYEPTLKSRLLSKLAKMTTNAEEQDFESVENMLLFLPEMLLIGLQKHHKEYAFNFDTKEGYEQRLEETFALISEYIDDEGNDAIELSNMLQEELMKNGFLKKMFENELEKAENSNKKK